MFLIQLKSQITLEVVNRVNTEIKNKYWIKYKNKKETMHYDILSRLGLNQA